MYAPKTKMDEAASRDAIVGLGKQLRSPLVMQTLDTFIAGGRLPLDTPSCLLNTPLRPSAP